mgnify:CR=1 FL=1
MDLENIHTIKEEVLEPGTLTHLFPEATSLERQLAYVKKVITDTRAVHEDMDVFENAVLVINGIEPDVFKMEGCETKHIWKAIEFIKTIQPEVEFSHEVLMYIKSIASNNGIYFYPPGVGFDEDNEMFNVVQKRALEGPFPLTDDYIGIQAAKFLKIEQYLGE